MKSSQQDNIVRTKCKDCVLAIYKDKTQTACLADRIEKLEHFEAYDEEKNFFVIERLCNYYRDNRENYILDGAPAIEKIKLESQISFDVFIDCNKIDKDYKNRIIEFYLSTVSKYDERKINIHLFSSSINKNEKHEIFELRSYIGNPDISFIVDYRLIHDKIMATKRSYHMIVSKEIFPTTDFIYDANELVNTDMKKAIIIDDENVKAVSNLAYKIKATQEQTTNYSEIISSIIENSRKMGLYHKTL